VHTSLRGLLERKVRLKDGLIERYEEIFERAQVLVRLGFADERILKSVRKWAGG